MAPDVLLYAELPFPTSLPQFQRLFPDDTACAHYLEQIRWDSPRHPSMPLPSC